MAGGIQGDAENLAGMNASAERKALLRQQLRQELQQLPSSVRAETSEQLRGRLTAQQFWKDAPAILAFAPAKSEPDVWPAVLAAGAEGRKIYLPRYEAATDRYVPVVVEEPGSELRAGTHGILEPPEHCPIATVMPLDLILVPGVGFTSSGGRLGRGRGYYDRMLVELPGVRCGVAFDLQIISELPLEPHDARLDYLVTPSLCLPFSNRARS